MSTQSNLVGRARFLKALRCEPTDRPPIWMMRQAGRSLPEYLALKEGKRFTELVQDPSTAAEITLQPIRRFNYDAAVIFSDILVVAEAMGVSYELLEKGGIQVDFSLEQAHQVDALRIEGVADHIAYTDRQYLVLAEVTKALCVEYPLITAQRIVGHSDIAPGRKTDPGPAFDWQRFRHMLT